MKKCYHWEEGLWMARKNINKAFINLSNLAAQMTDSVPHQIVEYVSFFCFASTRALEADKNGAEMLTVTKIRMSTLDKPSPELRAKTSML